MKKITALFLTTLLLLSFVACEKTNPEITSDKQETNQTPSTTSSAQIYNKSDPEFVLESITDDFSAAIKNLQQELEKTFTEVGNTYNDYQKNKGLVDKWINAVLSESDALFTRTREKSVIYFNLIASSSEHISKDFCDESLEAYYDAVDAAMDKYYDDIYDDAMDDLYDRYYDGIIDNAYDDIDYVEWSNTSTECYTTWANANSAIYKKWSDENSYIYGLWSAMRSEFCWNNNFNVDAIIADYIKYRVNDDNKQEETTTENKITQEENTDPPVNFEAIYKIRPDGKAEVVGFEGDGNQVTIDSSYNGHDVVSIAASAFENCTMLERITIWADIEEIGDNAFKGCSSLTKISISIETTKIGDHAFEGCSDLATLTIWGDPDIGDYAFAGCTSLKSISIGTDTKNIGAHAFENCTSVTSLIIWGIERIGDYAFAGCTGIKSVSIPSDTISIGNHAFEGCTSLSSVIIWDDETAIGKDAFEGCTSLAKVPASRGDVPEYNGSTNNKGDTSDNGKIDPSVPTHTGLRPEFKKAMDSYEAFYDEYCDFILKYKANPTDLKLLAEYADMLIKLSDMEEAFEAWEDENLSKEELAYYLEVTNRITQKLIAIA